MEEYRLEDLEYATDWEKAYGVTDDRIAELSRHQSALERFKVRPTCRCDSAELADLRKMRAYASSHGFEPTADDNVFEKARVDFIHTTVKYEGSTMSAEDVALILKEDVVIPDKTLSEHLEVMDVNAAFDLMVSYVAEGRSPSPAAVLDIHRLAAAHLEDCEAGEWRWDQRYVAGSLILPPPPKRVEGLVEDAFAWYGEDPTVERAALFHLLFEDIHPFQDGNGRTGRIVMNHMLMSQGYPVIALKADPSSTKAYYDAIASFVKDRERRDGTGMVELTANALYAALQRQIAKVEQARDVEETALTETIKNAEGAEEGQGNVI